MCEIERFRQNFRPTGYLRNILLPFFKKKKIFLSPKMAAILNFRISTKMQKHKFVSVSSTVRDRAISLKFLTHRVFKQCTIGNFQNFLSPKMAAILNFRISPKMEKHKFASISLTMRDRAISSKFSTHRLSDQTTLCNFQKKILLPPKWQPF